MSHVLLVTGSRALADTDDATEWAQGHVRAALAALPRGGWLLTGGCDGSPDVWARTTAKNARIPWAEYRLDGLRVTSDGRRQRWHQGRPQPWEWEQKLVNVARQVVAAGGTAHVLALIAPWSATRGAVVTAEMAEGSGLTVERIVCREELAP